MKTFNLSEMRRRLPYIVLTGSACGTFQCGDNVRLEENGDLMCMQAGGWLTSGEWEEFDSQVVVVFDESAVSRIKSYRDEYDRILKSVEDTVKGF